MSSELYMQWMYKRAFKLLHADYVALCERVRQADGYLVHPRGMQEYINKAMSEMEKEDKANDRK